MYLLRRSALRALSTPSTCFITKPRSITTYTPASFKLRQQPWISSSFQRRFASDDATKTEGESASKKSSDESVTEAATESFSQTATEAPIAETSAAEVPAESSERVSSTEDQSTIASAIHSTKGNIQERAVDAFGAVAAATPFGNRPVFGQATPNPPNKTLYVGNLFFEVTEDQLQRVFSRFGRISKTTMVYDTRGLSRGFGYVTFEEQSDATAAMENLNQQVFEGRRMNVQYHKARIHESNRAFTSGAPPSKTLFIGNMSFEMSDKDLNDLFRDIRNVMDVRVAIDRRTGQPRGFAHADFVDIQSAEKAKEVLENKEIYGRRLRVDFSTHSNRTTQVRPDRNREGQGRPE
ncbi:RNA-binding domain-containing protein [Lepidopterella palustris CBS 459.81]|uniref:RNA-binding domain-containing protein n=1 Tax=Lepidopterella palustris CBS 459.81 TaxID=1314670 RepID=A0A8E2JGY1_9PEZI|nr:RNA-binding domain-containing protein [Lepidopterella palustris CBS 459.81]